MCSLTFQTPLQKSEPSRRVPDRPNSHSQPGGLARSSCSSPQSGTGEAYTNEYPNTTRPPDNARWKLLRAPYNAADPARRRVRASLRLSVCSSASSSVEVCVMASSASTFRRRRAWRSSLSSRSESGPSSVWPACILYAADASSSPVSRDPSCICCGAAEDCSLHTGARPPLRSFSPHGVTSGEPGPPRSRSGSDLAEAVWVCERGEGTYAISSSA